MSDDQRALSAAYREFPPPIQNTSAGFDFHVYYMQSSPEQTGYARELHGRMKREFPEVWP